VLLGLSFLPVSLGYKPTKLKVLASVSLLILSEVVTLAFLQNYIMATFILFIYVGAIIVLFTVVLLTNPEAAVRVNPYVTRTPDALILFLWVVMYTHFPKFWEELLDHKFALVARVNSTIKLEDYVKYERLAELQKTSANDLLSISSLLTAH
jgi:hypothetical protein